MNPKVDEIELEAEVEAAHIPESVYLVEVEVEVVVLGVEVIDTGAAVHLDEDHARDLARLVRIIRVHISIKFQKTIILMTQVVVAKSIPIRLRQEENLVHVHVLVQEIVAHHILDRRDTMVNLNNLQIKSTQTQSKMPMKEENQFKKMEVKVPLKSSRCLVRRSTYLCSPSRMKRKTNQVILKLKT